MKIEKALDWNQVSDQLRNQMNSVGYNPDLNKMLKNINTMVTELSKLEVTFRRIHKSNMTDEKVLQINNAISHFEKLIIMATLMK
jgi:hypothetical protein